MYQIKMNQNSIRNLVSAAICLALCMVLPFLTGQIPQIGSALSPMHIPVLLGGFICGPWCAMVVGFVAPLLRFVLFGMPPIFPTGLAMSFELAAYGLVAGILYTALPKKFSNVYVSLIAAMLTGRIVWGGTMVVLMGLNGSTFTWAAFTAGAFINAIPGIIVHIVFVPMLVLALQKSGFIEEPVTPEAQNEQVVVAE